MKVNVWKISGLVMALMGAITMAQAEQGENGKRGEHGQRGEGAGQFQKGEQHKRPERPERPEQGKRPSREQMMKKYDVDGNGELSETERAALRADMEKRQGKRPERPSREQMMKKYDVDGNGELSETERAALRADMEKRRANRPEPSPEQEGERPERPTREQIMKRFDADGNGELSEAERMAMRKAFEARRREQAEHTE